MKIEFLVLADAAQAVGGKLYILGGGWNVYRAPNYPVNVQLALAIGISFSPNEAGIKYPLSVVIADEAGVPIVPEITGQVEIGLPSEELPKGITQKLPIAINVGLQVPRPGKYAIVVSAGSSKAQTSFDAIFVGRKVELTLPEAPGGTNIERGN